jgi:spore germination cell wall hydrolase CwlJ-like protein
MGRFRRAESLAIGLIGATLFAVAQASAAFSPLERAGHEVELLDEKSAQIQINEKTLYCLTLAIYFEGGSTGESEEGQRYIARVVNLRAQSNRRIWGGSDLCDVVFYNRRGVCQFSFACLPLARRTPRFGPAWQFSQSIAVDELDGNSDVHARFIRYYMNPALTPPKNACRFRREFVPVLVAGRHHFFREPLPRERTKIARGEYDECKQATKPKSKKATKSAKKPAPKKSPGRVATNP